MSDGFTDDLVGGIGTLIRTLIQSDNFVTGASGWRVERNGDAEFNQGTFRGSVIVGTPGTGPGAEIGATLPTLLAAYYTGLLVTVTQFAFLIYADATDYHYSIAGIGPGGSKQYVEGWVSGGVVFEYEAQEIIVTQPVMNFAGRQLATQTMQWQFGASWGAARSPANSHNDLRIIDTQVSIGGAAGDTGSLLVSTDMFVDGTADFTGSIIAQSASFTSVAVGSGGLVVTGASTHLNGSSNTAADLSIANVAALPVATTIGGLPAPGTIVDAVQVTTVGNLTAAASAETNISNLAMSGVMTIGAAYDILLSICLTCTVATDTYVIRIRTGTALTGTIIGESDGTCGAVITAQTAIEYIPTVAGNTLFFVSFLRRAGTGTIAATGDNAANSSRTLASVRVAGPSTKWRLT